MNEENNVKNENVVQFSAFNVNVARPERKCCFSHKWKHKNSYSNGFTLDLPLMASFNKSEVRDANIRAEGRNIEK